MNIRLLYSLKRGSGAIDVCFSFPSSSSLLVIIAVIAAVTWLRSYALIIIFIVLPIQHANVLLSLKCSDSQLPFWKVSHSSVSYSASRIGLELLCGPMVRVYVAS